MLTASSRLNYNTDMSYADRATINMVHDNTALTISQDVRLPIPSLGSEVIMTGANTPQEASRLEDEAKRRLLQSRRLSLVVDLDQTIIHATVDPTVAEWQQDQKNPNHGALKDVQAFQLLDDGPGMRGCWYYIKLRPGLKEFLENVSRLYELHIYTMGTRAYAQNIVKIVDPDRKIFGDRILSRDESGSLTAKSLHRLFPVDTKMVVIIDDRGDVWHWSENLVKVTPYDFFVGIGDINSSFLPKKPDLQTRPRILRLTAPKPNNDLAEGATIREPEPDVAHPLGEPSAVEGSNAGSDASTSSDTSTLDRLVSMSGGSDPATLQQQASKQDEALTAQLEDRPLLQKQKQLEAEEEAAASTSASAENSNEDVDGEEGSEHPSEPASKPHRHNLLHDDDTELKYLEQNLREVHRTFFEEYDRRLTQAQGGRLAALRGERSSKKLGLRVDDKADLELVPDIKTIMPQMKTSVLEGVVIVFSGVLPLGTDVQRSDIALWAMSFGARVSERVNRRTTHVVAGRPRTSKVRQAARREHINIVTPRWLLDSISQWQWLDEEPYLIPVDPQDRQPASGGSGGNKDEGYTHSFLSSADEADGGANGGDTDDNTDMNMDDDDPDGVRPAELEDNQPSPIEGFFNNYAWKEVDSELADFLGSDDEDESDGGESVRSTSSQTNRVSSLDVNTLKRKRSRSATPSEAGDMSASKTPSPTKGLKVPLRPASGSSSGPDSSSTPPSSPPETTTPSSSEATAAADSVRPSGSRLAKRQRQARERTTGLKTVANATDVRSSLPTPEGTGAEEEVTEGEDPGGGGENTGDGIDVDVGIDDPDNASQRGDGENKNIAADTTQAPIYEDDDDDELARELEAEMDRAEIGEEDDGIQ